MTVFEHLGWQRITVKSTYRHLICFGQLSCISKMAECIMFYLKRYLFRNIIGNFIFIAITLKVQSVAGCLVCVFTIVDPKI